MTNPRRLFLKLLLTAGLALGSLTPSYPAQVSPSTQDSPPILPESMQRKHYKTRLGSTVVIPIVTQTEDFTLSYTESALTIDKTLLKPNLDGSVTTLLYITSSELGYYSILVQESGDLVATLALTIYGSEPPQGFELSPVYVFFSNSHGAYYTIHPSERDNILAHPEWGYVLWGIAFWAYTPILTRE